MGKTFTDKSFESEQAARDYAATVSEGNTIYVILTADQYFVSASKSIQPYEKLVAAYIHGRLCSS
jgi:hypothetical protein